MSKETKSLLYLVVAWVIVILLNHLVASLFIYDIPLKGLGVVVIALVQMFVCGFAIKKALV